MNQVIKKYADNRDLEALKYIFVDALDVDPTFVRYEEEYKYCKNISGLLELHKELTPFQKDEACWDEEYWTCLKMDLIKNFSDCRMMHMKEVAQVFLAEKKDRILKERASASATSSTPSIPVKREKKMENAPANSRPGLTKEMQERRIAEEKLQLEEYNRQVEAERQRKKEKIEQEQKKYESTNKFNTDNSPKKEIGIAVAVVAVAAVVVILILK